MKIEKKFIILTIIFSLILIMSQYQYTYAKDLNDLLIISDTNITANDAEKWAKSKGATETFIDLTDLYFEYSEDCGNVNPAIAYVQAAKETGFGNFGGILDESYHNPCGLKISSGGGNNSASSHQVFENWDEGVQAHLDHLALYAGADGYPKRDTYDPRHFITLKGKAKTVNDLTGNWATSNIYGEEINKLYRDLLKYSDASINDEEIENNNDNKYSVPYPAEPESIPEGLDASSVIPLTITDDKEDTTPNEDSNIGFKTENDSLVYYRSDYTKVIGWLKTNDKWYFMKDDGTALTGWLNDYGRWYYFSESHEMIKGWEKINDKWYYFKTSGEMTTGPLYDGTNLYYFDSSGTMVTGTGWKDFNGNFYHISSNGVLKTGWIKDNNIWYYLQGDGTMVTGYKVINSKIYGFDKSGKMITRWIKDNNNWYFFNSDGSMATGWLKDSNSKRYYLYNTGAMVKGWINLNDSWYYLNNSGDIQTGWLNFNEDSYYLDPSTGKLLTDTVIDNIQIFSDGTTKNSDDKSNISSSSKKNNDEVIIVIDAGHYNNGDKDSERTFNGITYSETDLNLELAKKLKDNLEEKGYTTLMTREDGDDSSVSVTSSLANRVNIANNAGADLFISIHNNTTADYESDIKGVEVYYSSTRQDDEFGGNYNYDRVLNSKNLATSVSKNIASSVSTNNRGAKDNNLFVCRNTNMPAILIETGFISNIEEAKRCADKDEQENVAEAIADAVSELY